MNNNSMDYYINQIEHRNSLNNSVCELAGIPHKILVESSSESGVSKIVFEDEDQAKEFMKYDNSILNYTNPENKGPILPNLYMPKNFTMLQEALFKEHVRYVFETMSFEEDCYITSFLKAVEYILKKKTMDIRYVKNRLKQIDWIY